MNLAKTKKMEQTQLLQGSDLVVLTKDFLKEYTNQVTQLACDKALEKYKQEKDKNEKLTITNISAQEKCTPFTVRRWIEKGVKIGSETVKLKGARSGEKKYTVTRYDLNQFLLKKRKGAI